MRFIEFIRQYREHDLLIGGHRGHLSAARENTPANFDEVKHLGIPYIEIDVQLSKDDEAVIFHDKDLSERTPLTGTVRDHTVQELKDSFDLCTLEEAILWCKASEMYVLLEIKSGDYGEEERSVLAERIISLISESQFQDQCIPFSIDGQILKQIKNQIPGLTIALIVPEPPEDPVALMQEMKADIYLSWLKDLDLPLVEKLHTAGYIADGSVVNTPEDLERALLLRVDMIESDYPDRMLDLYRKVKE